MIINNKLNISNILKLEVGQYDIGLKEGYNPALATIIIWSAFISLTDA